MAYTLAYFSTYLIMVVISVIVLAHTGKLIKHLFLGIVK
jgi:hypothetical protein